MKHLIFIILFVVFNTLVSANIIANDSIIQQVPQQQEIVNYEKQEEIGSLTLAVNTINNIFTWSAVMIAVLTLIIGILGGIGYIMIKRSQDDNIKKVDKKIAEINSKKQELDNYIYQTKIIEKKLKAQEKYMINSNEYSYKALDTIANQISDSEKAIVILKFILHNYQIANLYSADNNLKFSSLAYFQENGALSDTEHLEYVANCDLVETNRKWAREIIGVIKHKYRE